MTDCRIPKREVDAEVLSPGLKRTPIRLFLSRSTFSDTGFERPSDLLRTDTPFLPAVDAKGATLLLRRDAVLAVSVAVTEEVGVGREVSTENRDTIRTEIEVAFETGERLRGTLVFSPFEGCRRPSDYLNKCDQFFPLWDGRIIHLVNRARIARVSVLTS